jgi:drug/metabolite transporter (DMT)-like permease
MAHNGGDAAERMEAGKSANIQAVAAALMTPLFLGVAPIFGKLSLVAGADSFTTAALRTLVAVVLLWVGYLLFARRYVYIYPAGLLGCIVVGAVNGIGSLFYYSGLGMLDASLVQLLNGMYIVFAVLLARINGEPLSPRIIIRVLLAVLALVFVTGFSAQPLDWLGVGLMLANAIMFAGTLILSQYVLYEMPAPTATLYILTTMGIVVLMAWASVSSPDSIMNAQDALLPIVILGVTTALSRLAMFASVQVFGSLRTVIIAIAEIAVALLLAFVVLGDRLAAGQWVGVGLLALSLMLIRARDLAPRGVNPNALLVHDMASVQYQRIAFHRAFGKKEQDNEFGTMQQISTEEMQAIKRMMGANTRVDPFPMSKNTYLTLQELDGYLNTPPKDDTPPPAPKDE